MTPFAKTFEVRIDDVDPNRHLSSARYLDYAVHTRISYMHSAGVLQRLERLAMAPVVFRDDVQYRRELRLNDQVDVTLELAGLSEDGARWRLRHQFLRGDGSLSALIRSDGAWFDLNTRRLVVPPDEVTSAMQSLSRSEDFEQLPVPTAR